MKVSFNFNSSLPEPFAIDNGVKLGDIPAPTLFSVYFAMTLTYAFQDFDIGALLRFRTSSKVFNLRRFKARWKIFDVLVHELFSANYADFVAHSEANV